MSEANSESPARKHICYLPTATHTGQQFTCKCGLMWEWNNDDQEWETYGAEEEVR